MSGYTKNATDALADALSDGQVDDRLARELVRCLRRLLKGRTAEEILTAFGAPGDFGYDTPIGQALSRLYLSRLNRHDDEPAESEKATDDDRANTEPFCACGNRISRCDRSRAACRGPR